MLPEGLFNYKMNQNKIGFYSIYKHGSSFALHKISEIFLSLKDQFENLKNITPDFRPEEFVNGVGRWRHDVSSMTADGSSVVIKSTGTDPHFPLPPFQILPNASYVLKIDLIVPSDTELKVFYQTMGKPHFSTYQDVGIELKKGRNVVYLKVPGPGLVGRFRLDPGRKTGRYILHDVEVREMPLQKKQKQFKSSNATMASKVS